MANRVQSEEEKQDRQINEEPAPENGPDEEMPRRSLRHSPWFRWAVILLVGILAIAAFLYWRYSSVRESTDDAEIDGHVHPVSARVGGTVVKVLVQDNQRVEAGAPLVQIDPTDYQVALDRAKADLAETEATLHVSRTEVPITSTTTSSQLSATRAGVAEARAGVVAAQKEVDAARARMNVAQAKVRENQANQERAARDLDRMKALVAKEEISRQQYDLAVATAASYGAQVDSAESQVHEAEQEIQVAESHVAQQQARVAQAQTAVASAGTGTQQVAATRARAESAAARVQQMQAAVEVAQLNLSYTTVRSPAAGIVSQRTVEVGQVIQPGQPLLAVIPLDLNDIWVTANFKETQLRNMRPGQPVTIKVDTFGGREYKGHVDSIAAVTGARSSLLPPENATGNFVKVVQRIPVKIVLEKGEDPEHRLRPGMSVEPTVLTK